ncbi:lipoprotein NlpI [Stieleria neptunia]|uniref:Lipoprotein NlpI n=1 Tax=Stieleria neptunia TaxID=2527979 RepID=A0A518HIQ8_9BACT|nr:tetratricopeptide repeat protein [Stieleria neptunia]QDV40693.1 lipoprotein NlpI [Stieleria neptunia]
MKFVFVALLMCLSFSAVADEPQSVTKQDVVAAAREFRTAVELIKDVHTAMAGNAPENFAVPKSKIVVYQRARKHLERSIDLNPFYPDVYVYLANSYWEIEDDLDRAIKTYSKAIDLDPTYDDVISARASVLVMLNRIADAKKDLQRLESLKSPHAAMIRTEIATHKEVREQ